MIAGIGTDIVEILRMQQSLERLGERFAKRILSSAEFTEFSALKTQKNHARFLAKRFAAKEAAVKALGTGFSQGISMQHISVIHDELGKPELLFNEVARQLLDEKKIKTMHLSIADEHHYAIAYVVLEY